MVQAVQNTAEKGDLIDGIYQVTKILGAGTFGQAVIARNPQNMQ